MSYPAVVIVDYDPRWPARFGSEARFGGLAAGGIRIY